MSLQTFNQQYDYITGSATFVSRNKPVLLLLNQQDYRGANVTNFTKWTQTAETGKAGTYRYRYKNVPELGNVGVFEQRSFDTAGAITFQLGQQPGAFLVPGAAAPTLMVSSISNASPAVVTFTGTAPAPGSFLRVDSINGMPEIQGAIVKVGSSPAANQFTISVNASDFPGRTSGPAKLVVTPLLHTWKIISVTRSTTASLTLSNVDDIVRNSILTLSTGGTQLSTVTNQRVKVLEVKPATWEVVTDLDTTGLLTETTILTAETGVVPSAVSLQSVQPDPNIVDAGPLESYPVLAAGDMMPAGETDDLIRVDLLINGVR